MALPLAVGLTGGIGSGKTTAARMLEVLGAPIFYSDTEGKRILDADPAVRNAVGSAFGVELYASGTVDRKALAAIVFNDKEALARLNAIVHPAVRAAFAAWRAQQNAPYVVNEAAVMIESGTYRNMDRLVVVTAPETLRVQRVMQRDGVEREQVLARMRNQMDDAERLSYAQHVLVNDDTRLLTPQVLALHVTFSTSH